MLKGFVDHAPQDVTLHEHADVMVFMMQPFQIKNYLEGQHKTCFTMWESTQLEQRFIDWLPVYDQVIVPCQHNLHLFSEHHSNVKLVPLGVDATFFKPKKRPSNPRFRFHAGGSQWIRKGLDIVLEAFKLANLDAELHLKPNPEAFGVPSMELPDNVFMHRDWFTEQQTLDFFRSADCYISASRGEGFGLMPLQAMACGVPTIMNAVSGQMDFAHLAPILLSHKPVPSHYGGMWDESNPKELAEAMREVYANHDRYLQHAKSMLPRVKEWSWDSAARKLADALPVGSLIKDPKTKHATVWYHVALNRTLTCDIADKTYRFVKGVPLRVSEGVLDVVRAAGYVDSYTMEAT
jgi:glycosyltransferase involved in cell wall biosynthesis